MAVLSVADASMTTIYISDSGDDKNDGLSLSDGDLFIETGEGTPWRQE